MGKLYVVAFDSTSNYGGANNNKRTYITNWESILPPDKQFKVSFTYMSVVAAVVNTPTLMTLHIDLGQTTTFQASGSPFASDRYLGCLLFGGTDNTNEYYYATTETNPPIYIKSRPTNSFTEVALHQGLTQTNYNTPVPSDYVLTLCFEEL